MIMAIGAVFLALQAVMSLFSTAQTQRIVNQRLQFKERFESTNEAMIELRKSRGLDEFGNFAMPLQWFNQLVVRSGLPYQPARWFAYVRHCAAWSSHFVYVKLVGGFLTAGGLARGDFRTGANHRI
jgi:tight adherence protein B